MCETTASQNNPKIVLRPSVPEPLAEFNQTPPAPDQGMGKPPSDTHNPRPPKGPNAQPTTSPKDP